MKGTLSIVVVVIVILIGFLGWNVKRQINYNLSYKSMVEKTVRDMVKPEALKTAPVEENRK